MPQRENMAACSRWWCQTFRWNWRTLTWTGDAVPVPRHVVVQREQHHPHGEGEHAGQEAVEDQVEEQDEGCRSVGHTERF